MRRTTAIVLPIAALAILVSGILIAPLQSSGHARQPYPQSPASGSGKLLGKQVTIYLNNSSASATSRTRESSGTDPLVRINETPISIAGTIAAFSNEGGGRWIILTRRESGDAWIPLDSIQLIEFAADRR